MKLLVTGATGFIGNYVIQELLNRNIEVIATSTNQEKAHKLSWFSKVVYLPYQIKGKDTQDLYEYFGRPNKIIHLAWTGLPNYTQLFHIEENLWNDYFFLKNIMENGCKDLTITGTCFEYGLIEGCLNEETIPNPQNVYAIAKDSLRKFLSELQKHTAFDFKWVRLFYMYGKGQAQNSLIPQLEKVLANNETIFNMSGGEQVRDYMKVEEVAQKIVAIALQNNTQGIINCATGKPVKVKDFVKQYLQTKNKNIQLNLGYYPYSKIEPMSFWGDVNKINSIENV